MCVVRLSGNYRNGWVNVRCETIRELQIKSLRCKISGAARDHCLGLVYRTSAVREHLAMQAILTACVCKVLGQGVAECNTRAVHTRSLLCGESLPETAARTFPRPFAAVANHARPCEHM